MHPPDIFISYAREDEAWVRPLVAELERCGWSVFWDRRIPTGKDWRSHIGAALERARCVVVVWSRDSITAQFVLEEADEGKERCVLFPIFRHQVRPPLGFRGIHAADLSEWSPGVPTPPFDSFFADLNAMLGSPPDQAAAVGSALTKGPIWAEIRRELVRNGPNAILERLALSQSRINPLIAGSADSQMHRESGPSESPPDAPKDRPSTPSPVGDAPTPSFANADLGAGCPSSRDPPAQGQSVLWHEPMDAAAQSKVVTTPLPAPTHRAGRLAFAALLSAGTIGIGAYVFTHPSTERPPATVEVQPAAITPPSAVEPATLPLATEPAPTQPIPSVKPARLQPSQIFTDTLVDGSPCPFCPEMLVIPARSFTMGPTAEERKWAVDQGGQEDLYKYERPARSVRIAADFALGRMEVTRGQFARFVDATKRDMSGGCRTWTSSKRKLDAATGWWSPGFDQDDTHPVVCVSWEDATAYVAWLKQQTGEDYRLPSEAEWEYAARAGSATARFWGDDFSNSTICTYANVADQAFKKKLDLEPFSSCDDQFAFTSPVGTLKPNRFKLFDLQGNVWEWNQDCYRGNYDDVPRFKDPSTSGDCSERVLRGGSWAVGPWFLRPTNRTWDAPVVRDDDTGFRVARTLTP